VAIQPIDLQTLYGQLDKIGKTQVQQQQAAQAARDAEQAGNKHEAEERLSTVGETQAGDEEVGVVHEREGSPERDRDESRKEKKGDESAESPAREVKREIIQDPALGKHVDLSG
jgi:hypothetical protein